ncbi:MULTISPECIES: lamin tail domain-containing protein [unclassified Streptomyces]|uniref:lamin tail domain-containing protein n=1 Tax=unclassified Streptomyces TaxID=2593676 RepID=UPI0033327E45
MSAARDIRRIAAALLASGVVLGAGALPAAAADGDGGRHRSSVVIGKVQYNSPGHDDGSNRSRNAEWVEVKNLSRHAVNLRGYTLTDKQGNRYRFDRLRLDGRSSVKVHTGYGRDMRHHVYQDRRDYMWDNNRDTATLRDARGHVLDRESWGRGHHHR